MVGDNETASALVWPAGFEAETALDVADDDDDDVVGGRVSGLGGTLGVPLSDPALEGAAELLAGSSAGFPFDTVTDSRPPGDSAVPADGVWSRIVPGKALPAT